MNSLIKTAVMFFIILGITAFAAAKFAKIDLREKFKSIYINLYPDGRPYYNGVDILVPVTSDKLAVKVDLTGEGTCKLIQVSDKNEYAIVRIKADLDIDDGACDVTTQLKDGRKAVVNIIYEGT